MKIISLKSVFILSLCIVLSFFMVPTISLAQLPSSSASQTVQSESEKTAGSPSSIQPSAGTAPLTETQSTSSSTATQTTTTASTPTDTVAATPTDTAASQPTGAVPQQQPIGQIVWVTGTIKAVSANKNIPERLLDRRSPVYLHDTILSDDKSTCQIVFSDNSTISMRANTVFRIDEYEFGKDVPKGKSKFVANIVKGGFRTITGLIPKENAENYQVKTPVATIAVQGTQYEVVHTLKSTAPKNDEQVDSKRNSAEVGSSSEPVNTPLTSDKKNGVEGSATTATTATTSMTATATTATTSMTATAPTGTTSMTAAPTSDQIVNQSAADSARPSTKTTNENMAAQAGKTVVGQIEGTPIVTTGGKTFTLSDTNRYVSVPNLGMVVKLPSKPVEFSQPTRIEPATFSPNQMNMNIRPVPPTAQTSTTKTSDVVAPAAAGTTGTGGGQGGGSSTGAGPSTGSGSSSGSGSGSGSSKTGNFCIM